MSADSNLRPILYIGRIGRAHGLGGEVRIQSLTSDPDRFNHLNECLLFSADEKTSVAVQTDYARVNGDQILLKLRGTDSREAAEKLNGRFLAVRREQAVALPDDTWFICDLIGCAVYEAEHGYLGELCDVMQNGAQDVYAVRAPGEQDLLFPAMKSILKTVDISARRIDICLPDGLYEVYRGRKL